MNQFLTFLGDNRGKDLNFISRKQISDFQQSIAKRLSPATANLALKILRVALKDVFRYGLIQSSPADQIKILATKAARAERRPFTVTELRAVYRRTNAEWKGMFLFGLYTGQRLKDIATLTSGNLDLEADELRLTTHKTGRRQIVPLAKPLRDYVVENLLNSDAPNAPLFLAHMLPSKRVVPFKPSATPSMKFLCRADSQSPARKRILVVDTASSGGRILFRFTVYATPQRA